MFFYFPPVCKQACAQCKIKKPFSFAERFPLVAGDQAISNFLEGYELVVDLWKYMNRRDD
jgi:hypothetical protein